MTESDVSKYFEDTVMPFEYYRDVTVGGERVRLILPVRSGPEQPTQIEVRELVDGEAGHEVGRFAANVFRLGHASLPPLAYVNFEFERRLGREWGRELAAIVGKWWELRTPGRKTKRR